MKGQQIKAFSKALISAYPTFSELKIFIRINFNKSLNAIVREDSLKNVVFDLIEVFQSNGEIDELIQIAYENKPNNPLLKSFVNSINLGLIEKEDAAEKQTMVNWKQINDWIDENQFSKVFEELYKVYDRMDNEKSIYNQLKKEYKGNFINVHYTDRLRTFVNGLKYKLEKY